MSKRNRSGKRKMTQREGGAHGRPKRDRSPDRGTPELRAKRQALVGEGGDATLSTRWLHILVARGLLDVAQQQAGESFARDRCLLYGKPRPGAAPMDRDDVRGGDGPSEAALREAKLRHDAACRALKRVGRQVFDAVTDVCAFDREPMLLRYARAEQFPTTTALRQWARISAGLEVLAEVMATNQKRAA